MSVPEHRQSSRGETRVFLENLPRDVRKDEIDKEFSMYGRIAKVYLIYDPPGSGFVEYFDSGDAEFAATSMNGAEFLGSKLKTQLTRGGVPRGRASVRRGFGNRGRGFSSNFGDRDGGFSMGRGGRGFGGGFRGGRGGFDNRGRGRRGMSGSFSSSRGYGGSNYSKGYSESGGFSQGGGGGRNFGGHSRGFSNNMNSSSGYRGNRYDDEVDQNGYQKYAKYDKYEKDYDKHDSSYMKYSSEKFSSYGRGMGSRKDSYPRSRSPLEFSPEGYRSTSPSYLRNRSRSPYGRGARNNYSSRNFEESPKSLSPGAREVFRRPRSKSSRNYSSDHQGEPSNLSYGRKEYASSSYGSRRSPMDDRY